MQVFVSPPVMNLAYLAIFVFATAATLTSAAAFAGEAYKATEVR